ncbi:disease resistance protein RPV1-like isoform X1 [Carya illinoinensis]|uniref:disease resistance protein RPV1-like isoform X1 n=1 Tax=Carya illinoinensis TaxID=32201 RepID=UPI001C722F71|nr:disease resistance protein RPV1-like isoform X1 [Carya illinoinensis]
MVPLSTQRASSSVPPSSSTSPRSRWIYDVFLNFHGEDTRKNFADHLYTALENKGIITFKDNEKLQQGKYISQELLKAIRESRYAIPIISKNYASSRWCLTELVQIVECMRETGLTILPVFYHVDPSEVRNQTEAFAEAFARHEEDPNIDMEKMQTWRVALKEVGNISGWHFHLRYESTIVQEINERILQGLSRNFSTLSKDLVGIESHVEEMMNILGIGLDDVRFIGIHGMGGVGKTTLAEVIYDRISYQFEASSFIACIREETRNHGLVSLQKRLLSKIFMERKINIWDDREGMNMIRNRLCNKKVFLVLDDVDRDQHLTALAGSHDWFGSGSRIILTSRDSHLLKRHGVNDIYKVNELNNDEALQLFSLAAFKKPHPEENYVDLSKGFVKYAQGLPLALKVLGSSLFGRGTNAWKGAWDQMKANPNKGILDVLQVGFDGLEDLQKKLFLDIACFFTGEVLDSILMDILESFGYYPYLNIDILMEKCLITIKSKRLRMHDLLQKMGQEIIYDESPNEPGRRSRLWHCEDVLHVLKNNTGTEVIEGIVLNLSNKKDQERFNVKAFSKMKKLRILKICNTSIVNSFSNLCDKLLNLHWHSNPLRSIPTHGLRVLEWFEYPSKSLSNSFRADNLIELRFPCSHIKQLWKGINSLGSLKCFDLSGSQYLLETPDLTGVPNLETLDLEGCTSLSKVHKSVGVLKQLRRLNLHACKRLKSFPNEISMESLEHFYLSDCSRFEKFPDIVGNMNSLRLLYLNGTAIKELPLSFKNLCGLSILSLHNCKRLSIFPSVICGLPSLKILDVSNCLALGGIQDWNGEEYLEQLYTGGTAIKFTKFFAVPEFCSNACSTQEMFITNDDSIGAFYIGYDDRVYCIRSLNEESNLETKGYEVENNCFNPKVICGSSAWGAEIPEWCNIRSFGSHHVKLPIHPNLDNNMSKWFGYHHLTIFDVDEHENSDPRIFESSHSDHQFVEFVYHFETNEGHLKEPLVLRACEDPFVGPLGFCVYIPAKWFLKQLNNLNEWSYIGVSVKARSSSVKVKECGACLVYQHPPDSEFYNTIIPYGLKLEIRHHLFCSLEMGSHVVDPIRF